MGSYYAKNSCQKFAFCYNLRYYKLYFSNYLIVKVGSNISLQIILSPLALVVLLTISHLDVHVCYGSLATVTLNTI